MSKQAKSKGAAPSAPVVVAVTNGLTDSERQYAEQIAKSAPELVASFKAYRDGEAVFMSRFWTLADTLRKPVSINNCPPAQLNGREVTLFLLSQGEHKVRVSEWKRVVEMSANDYELCRKLGLSKIDTLAVARGTLAIEAGEGDEEAKVVAVKRTTTDPEPAAHEPEKHIAPKEFREAFHAMFEAHGLKSFGDDVPYEFKGQTADGRAYDVRIFVDKLPLKE